MNSDRSARQFRDLAFWLLRGVWFFFTYMVLIGLTMLLDEKFQLGVVGVVIACVITAFYAVPEFRSVALRPVGRWVGLPALPDWVVGYRPAYAETRHLYGFFVSVFALYMLVESKRWGLVYLVGWPFAYILFAVGRPVIKYFWNLFQYHFDPVRYATQAKAKAERLAAEAAVHAAEERRKQAAEAALRKSREYWLQMDGFAFEANLANVLRHKDYRVELTKRTGDGGVDIWIHTKRGRIAVQCKAHAKPSGPAPVRDLFGVMTSERAVAGVVACTSGFSRNAIEFAHGKPILLMGLDRIIGIAEGTTSLPMLLTKVGVKVPS
jgi:hypothetical protein